MNADSLQQWIKILKRSNSESQYILFFKLLHKIIYNVLQNDEEKYRKLIGTTKSFTTGIKDTANGMEFLAEIGFTRTVENFVEFFSLPSLNTVTRCKFNDTLADISVVLENLSTRVNSAEKMKTIRQINSMRQNEIQEIMKDYEADRAEKEETNRRVHARLRKGNEKKESETKEKMLLLRQTLNTPR